VAWFDSYFKPIGDAFGWTLVLLLSIGLLFVGIEAIAAGVVGRELVPVIGSVQTKI
jgi:hypothetical protein